MNDSTVGNGRRILVGAAAGLWFLTGFLSAMWWFQMRQGTPGVGMTLSMAGAWILAPALSALTWRIRNKQSLHSPAPISADAPSEEVVAAPADSEPDDRPVLINILEIAGVYSILSNLNRSRLAERGIVLASPCEMGLIWTDEVRGQDQRILVHLSPNGKVTVNGVWVSATYDGIYTGITSAFYQLQHIPIPEPQPIRLTPLPLFAQLEIDEQGKAEGADSHSF